VYYIQNPTLPTPVLDKMQVFWGRIATLYTKTGDVTRTNEVSRVGNGAGRVREWMGERGVREWMGERGANRARGRTS
jgi:hypothetical protein